MIFSLVNPTLSPFVPCRNRHDNFININREVVRPFGLPFYIHYLNILCINQPIERELNHRISFKHFCYCHITGLLWPWDSEPWVKCPAILRIRCANWLTLMSLRSYFLTLSLSLSLLVKVTHCKYLHLLCFTDSWQPLTSYVDNKYEEYLNAESKVNRKTMLDDNRVHCCLYFISPTGHRLVNRSV